MNKVLKYKVICVLCASLIGISFLAALFLPKKEFSLSERRKLASRPEFTTRTYLSATYMKDFERYAVDTFPFREQWRSLKSLWEKYIIHKKDHHGIYQAEDQLATMDYPYNSLSVEKAGKRFAWIMDNYLDESNHVYYSVIPDKSYFLSENSGYLSYEYEKLVSQLKKEMGQAEYIDIFPTLHIDHYYTTDSHWKQEKIVDTAHWLLKGMGYKNVMPLYEKKESGEPFYGVYCGQSALPVKPDKMNYLMSREIQELQVYDEQNKKEVPVYDIEKIKGKDPYEMFVGGPVSLVTIKNPNAETDRKLILFRDSFGSSIAPLMSHCYKETTLIDIRYLYPERLKEYVNFENSDVLFLYSSYILNHSETIK